MQVEHLVHKFIQDPRLISDLFQGHPEIAQINVQMETALVKLCTGHLLIKYAFQDPKDLKDEIYDLLLRLAQDAEIRSKLAELKFT